MTSNAAVANAEKRKTELRETFHRIYYTLSSWMEAWYQLHARVYGHHLRASELCSRHSHRYQTILFTDAGQ